MLTGYNTDVVFEQKTFHVQTEDRGLKNPVIDTLVYCGGQILHQEKHSYAAILEAGGGEAEIARRLDSQHREFVRRTRHGAFARALGIGTVAVDTAAFDEQVVEFLTTDEELVWLSLRWEPGDDPALGGSLLVTREGNEEPVVGAEVAVRWIASGRPPMPIATLVTDSSGRIEVRWPHTPPPETAVVFSADAGPGGGKLRVALSADATALAALPVQPSSV